MTIDDFIRANKCERLYHMSEQGSWSQIQELGLLSASNLLNACGVGGIERDKIESEVRANKVPIKHPTQGVLYIRDQVPLRDNPERGIYLDKLLHSDVTRQEWLKCLNGKVFFWIKKDELIKMMCAWQYRGKPQWIITVDAKVLLEQYSDISYVSTQNTGSLYSGKMRGPRSFIPFNDCPFSSEYKELAIDDGVPNFQDFSISVDECTGTWVNNERKYQNIRHIWPQYL